MEDEGDACGWRVRGAATLGEEERQCRANAKGKEVARDVDGGTGGNGLSSGRTSTTVVTRSGKHVSAIPIVITRLHISFRC